MWFLQGTQHYGLLHKRSQASSLIGYRDVHFGTLFDEKSIPGRKYIFSGKSSFSVE
jgi:hypothetical protein